MLVKRHPKDPGDRVQADLAVLRQQREEQQQRNITLDKLPRHKRAKQDLISMGADAVPALVKALGDTPANTDTPSSNVRRDVAHDIADVLGDIGDPRAVEPLMAQFKNHITSAQDALAKFHEGVDALLRGITDPDDLIRLCCVSGLGHAKVDRASAAKGIAKGLSDPDSGIRFTAALAVFPLRVADPQLISELKRAAATDPSDRVRFKAEDALQALSRT